MDRKQRGYESKRSTITLRLMRKLLLLITLTCALGSLYAALAPPPAGAAGLSPPVADCSAHGRLTRHYSAGELHSALTSMPADIAQYTNCPDVIRTALVAEIGSLGGNGNGGGGSSFLPGWLIAVLVVVALGAAGVGVVALRNRRRPD